jgi:hypothetical protein
LDCAGRAPAATALWLADESESGVALRLPPQSRIISFDFQISQIVGTC